MSWLTTYLQWTRALESPTIFHRWCALTGVAHILGRRVWMVRGGKYAIFPAQVSTILVGDSAKVKKGIAMKQILTLLAACPPGAVNIMPERTSPQELFNRLQPRDDGGVLIPNAPAVGLIVAEELGTFFGVESFLETMATIVTRLLDAPHGTIDHESHAVASVLKTIAFKSWSVELRDPCVQILGGTTPTGVAKEIPAAARTGGFIGRVFFVYADQTDRAPNPLTDVVKTDNALQEQLIAGLHRVADLTGPVWFTKEGRVWFEDWYVHTHHPAVAHLDTTVVQETGFIGRKADHLLRIAIVLAACRVAGGEDTRFRVTRGDLEESLQYLSGIERGLPTAMREVGTAKEAEPTQRFLALLEKHPKGLARRVALQRLWRYGVDRRTLDERVLPTLMQSGQVTEITRGTEAIYFREHTSGGKLRRVREVD